MLGVGELLNHQLTGRWMILSGMEALDVKTVLQEAETQRNEVPCQRGRIVGPNRGKDVEPRALGREGKIPAFIEVDMEGAFLRRRHKK